jgi:hypothetical protein
MRTQGVSFHRLDLEVVASLSREWLRSCCCIAILGSYGMLSRSEPWHHIMVKTVEKPTRRSLSPSTVGSPEHCERVLRDAGFVDVASYAFLEPQTWTIESIVGYLYSTSVSSRKVLGSSVAEFEKELRSALLAFDPSGTYHETIHLRPEEQIGKFHLSASAGSLVSTSVAIALGSALARG